MKKSLLTLAIVLLAIAAQAQIKLHSNGHVSLGSLTTSYGAQVQPNGYVYFRPQYSQQYSWANAAKSNAANQKQWVVWNSYDSNLLDYHMFYVYGNGTAHATGYYTIPLPTDDLRSESEPIDGGMALSTILNLNGYYFPQEEVTTSEEIASSEFIQDEAREGMIEDLEKRNIGFSAQNMAEVFPDAVRTDPQARLCVDYNAVVTMLVGAVKQQQAEIELLRKTLEDNGLLESEKP